MRIRIGTSGYAFDDWTGRTEAQGVQGELFDVAPPSKPTFPFYPRGTKDKLRVYAESFDTVEYPATVAVCYEGN